MGVLPSAKTLSYGIEPMTPAVVERAEMSMPLGISTETDARCECLDDLDPDALPP